ncbi:MAG TPA: hypothetical protein PK544_03410 [Spirochaetota bacterium]|nr:hypothetical protein [Spirochaetota bacterium]HPJ37908.1 hypothetical protein [Spirochaetota bacterium]HPQ52408.1 hypothetical protein [Spirochaetota bacterium]
MKRRTINIRKLSIVLLITACTFISFAAILDFHEDNQFHSDCPLCRIQLDGSSTYVYCTTAVLLPLPVYESRIITVTTISIHTTFVTPYFPNAPPLS